MGFNSGFKGLIHAHSVVSKMGNSTQFNRNSFIVCFSVTITKDVVREPQIANYCNWATSVFHRKLDSVLKDTSLSRWWTHTNTHARFIMPVWWRTWAESSLANDGDACTRFLPTTLQSSSIFSALLPTPMNFAVANVLCPPFPTLSAFPKFAVVINET